MNPEQQIEEMAERVCGEFEDTIATYEEMGDS